MKEYERDKISGYIKKTLGDNFSATFENGFVRVYFRYMENLYGTTERYFLVQLPQQTFYENMESICEGIQKETHYKKYLNLEL